MEYALWIAKKNYAESLILKVGSALGDKDKDWLLAYAVDVIATNADKIDPLLRCFLLLDAQVPKEAPIVQRIKNGFERVSQCLRCGYNPPFCKCAFAETLPNKNIGGCVTVTSSSST